MRSSTRTVLFWDVDAPSTLDRLQKDPSDPLRELIPQFNAVFTYGGGTPVIRAYKRFGARECVPIYNALDPSTHYPAPPDKRFAADLAFLGNRLPDREERAGEFFFTPARLAPDMRFLLGGAGWHDRLMPENVRWFDHIYTRDHNAFNSTPRAVINISRESMARYGYSPATRVFEAAGAAACIITDLWEGIDMFFEPGQEILVAGNAEDVVAHLRNGTRHRAAIGAAAHRRVLAQHTYAHRALAFERALEGRALGARMAS